MKILATKFAQRFVTIALIALLLILITSLARAQSTGSIEVKVIDSADNSIVAVITISGQGITNTKSGSAVLFENVPVGTYAITVKKDGYITRETTADVATGQTTLMTVTLVKEKKETKRYVPEKGVLFHNNIWLELRTEESRMGEKCEHLFDRDDNRDLEIMTTNSAITGYKYRISDRSFYWLKHELSDRNYERERDNVWVNTTAFNWKQMTFGKDFTTIDLSNTAQRYEELASERKDFDMQRVGISYTWQKPSISLGYKVVNKTFKDNARYDDNYLEHSSYLDYSKSYTIPIGKHKTRQEQRNLTARLHQRISYDWGRRKGLRSTTSLRFEYQF